MIGDFQIVVEFLDALTEADEAVVEGVRRVGCQFCGGPLYRGDFERKPRFALLGVDVESFDTRYSLCCGREGCRRRTTPPSLRFLGRRVYIGAVVILASIVAITKLAATAARRATGVPMRTLGRWGSWWRGPFVVLPVFVELSGRIVPRVDRDQLPASLLEKMVVPFPGSLRKLLGALAPITTASCPDGSRFVRDCM
jgi:hypothetical protein